MRKYWESRLVRVGLGLLVFGSGPLLLILAAAAVGLLSDPNPNPIGPGILAFLTFWPGVVCLLIGAARVRFGKGAAILAAVVLMSSAMAEAQLSNEDKIRVAYDQWVDATNNKDIEQWASFLAPGAVFLPPNHPRMDDEEEIKEFYLQLFEDEQFHLECEQELVEVAESQDLAWSAGHCAAQFTTEDGLGHDRSKWAKVWRRMPNGEWKCVLNSWSSTLAN